MIQYLEARHVFRGIISAPLSLIALVRYDRLLQIRL